MFRACNQRAIMRVRRGYYGRGVTSLTLEAARGRAELISVDSYAIRLDLDQGDHNFGSVTTVRFRTGSPGASTFIDIAAQQLRSATLNGTALDLAACLDPAARRLALGSLEAVNELVVDAVMAYSHDGEGLHRHVDPADGRTYVYAMSFLDAAPRWYASFDQPDLKAPVHIEVRCPGDWQVAGNGPATELEPGHWTIASTGPLATYFTTLVAGPYHVIRDSHDGIPLSLLARQSLAEHLDRDAAALFAHTKHCFDELHTLFGVRYPWGEYHQAFVPEFNAGAMENPGCVTFRDTMVFRSRTTEAERLERRITIAHEMAHMWFGDLVTMRWWDDLWLNESFAEYLGTRVSGERAWLDFGIARKSWGYAADRRPSTHPVAGNGVADAASALSEFDGISYAKGASVLRQLAVHLGDDVFFDGLRGYIRAHADGNAEFADLIAAWTSAGAQELDAWTRAWLRTTGVDELSVADGHVLRRSADGTPRPHSIAVAAYAPDGTELDRARVTVTAERTPTGLRSGGVVVPDAADETWAKVVLSDPAWRAMPHRLAAVTDPRTRVAIWNALQLAIADAELEPSVAVDIVVAALPTETDDAVIRVVGRWAVRPLAACFLPDDDRSASVARIAGAMHAVADVAPPGSSARSCRTGCWSTRSCVGRSCTGWPRSVLWTRPRSMPRRHTTVRRKVRCTPRAAVPLARTSARSGPRGTRSSATPNDRTTSSTRWPRGSGIRTSARSPTPTSTGTSSRFRQLRSCAPAGWLSGWRCSPTRGPASNRRPSMQPAGCSPTTVWTPASAAR
jgi:aminopeptidase N